MKPIVIYSICVFLSLSTVAQKEESSRSKDENGFAKHSGGEKVKQHEKIIWAGTGINLNDKAKDARNVPDAVMTSFRQFFPDQQIDNVMKYHGLYAITFSNEVYTTTLIYKADGTFVEARTVATDSIVPEAVKESVRRSKKEYSTSDVVLIEKANKEKFYRLHLRKGKKDEYLVYNEQGQEVKYDY